MLQNQEHNSLSMRWSFEVVINCEPGVNTVMSVSIKADLGMTIWDGTWNLYNTYHIETHLPVK